VTARGKTYTGSGGSHEDDAAEVRSALVAESTGSVDQSTDTVRLHAGADEGATPRGGSGRGLLGLEELLGAVCLLRLAVGLAEEGAHDR